MGRKKTPTPIKKLRGTHRKDRANPNEPEPEICKLLAPNWLNDVALEVWNETVDELYDLGIITKLDAGILALYCEQMGLVIESKRALEKIRATGQPLWMLTKTPNGMLQQNALVTIANSAGLKAAKYAAELGMTPASRGRVSGINKPAKSQWDD